MLGKQQGEARLNAEIRSVIDKATPKIFVKTNTEANEALRQIQGKEFKNAETGIVAKVASNGRGKLISNAAAQKSIDNGFTREEHNTAAANVGMLFENGFLYEEHEDKNKEKEVLSIRRFAALVNLKGKLAEADILVKESVSANGSRIYTIELQEIKKPLERGTKSINVEAETDPQHTSSGRDKVALLAQKVNSSILLSYKNEGGIQPRKSKTDTAKKAFKERREKVIADFKKKYPGGEVIEGAFHGTNNFGFTTFDNGSSASFVQQAGEGHWFTDSAAMADSYTKSSGHIKRGKVNNNTPFKHSEYVEKLTEGEDALSQEEDGRWRLDRGRGYEYYDSVNDIPLEALKESYEAYFPKEQNGGVYGGIDLFMKDPLVVDAGGAVWNALPEPAMEGVSPGDIEMARHFLRCGIYKTEDDKYVLSYTDADTNEFEYSYDTIEEVVEKIVSEGVSERAARHFVDPVASWDADEVGKGYESTTRDWVEFAFANGCDGVIFENIVDYGKFQGKGKAKPHRVYVVERGEQVKMNDAKVEDDYGRAIPAEQRYDLDNNDIRFSYELKNPDGTVFGWYNSSKGEIWLNDDAIDFDTPIHEFTHAWSDIVEREDPRLANPRLFPAKKNAPCPTWTGTRFFGLKRDNYACASSPRSSM